MWCWSQTSCGPPSWIWRRLEKKGYSLDLNCSFVCAMVYIVSSGSKSVKGFTYVMVFLPKSGIFMPNVVEFQAQTSCLKSGGNAWNQRSRLGKMWSRDSMFGTFSHIFGLEWYILKLSGASREYNIYRSIYLHNHTKVTPDSYVLFQLTTFKWFDSCTRWGYRKWNLCHRKYRAKFKLFEIKRLVGLVIDFTSVYL